MIEDGGEGEMAMQRGLGLKDSRESAVCGGSSKGGGESGLWVGNGLWFGDLQVHLKGPKCSVVQMQFHSRFWLFAN